MPIRPVRAPVASRTANATAPAVVAASPVARIGTAAAPVQQGVGYRGLPGYLGAGPIAAPAAQAAPMAAPAVNMMRGGTPTVAAIDPITVARQRQAAGAAATASAPAVQTAPVVSPTFGRVTGAMPAIRGTTRPARSR